MNNASKIIVALDGLEPDEAYEMVKQIIHPTMKVKVNDLLDHPNAGPAFLGRLALLGVVPFADAKLYDIPDTMGRRVKNLVKAGARMITVAACNTVAAIKAAVDAAEGKADILVVTVLTSMNEEDCNLSFGAPVKAKVLQFARFAKLAGAAGIVCSGKELEFLSNYKELDGLVRVVPGIRPSWHQKPDDQKRTMTPAEAIKLGAGHLVMGRPILRPDGITPIEALDKTLAEIAQAEQVQKTA